MGETNSAQQTFDAAAYRQKNAEWLSHQSAPQQQALKASAVAAQQAQDAIGHQPAAVNTAMAQQAEDVQMAHNVIGNISRENGQFVAAQAVLQQKGELAAKYGQAVGDRFGKAYQPLLARMGYTAQTVQPSAQYTWHDDAEKWAWILGPVGLTVFVAIVAAWCVITGIKSITRRTARQAH